MDIRREPPADERRAKAHQPRAADRWARALPRQLAPRLAAAIVIAVQFVFSVNALVFIHGEHGYGFAVALAVVLLAGLVAVQLWYMARVVDDVRSGIGVAVLGVQACLAYAPLPYLGLAWITMSAFVAAGALLVLPARAGIAAFTLVIALSVVAELVLNPQLTIVLDVIYTPVAMVGIALGVYALTRLARLVVAAEEARAELAKMAVAQERLRVARDLHDLLGYSLSAISLKTELGRKLLAGQPERAKAELGEVLDISRQALTDVRAVASGYRELSLDAEARSARAVLLAADVDVTMDLRYDHVPTPVGTVLATVLREGVTNVLRHSKAEHVTISIAEDAGRVRMHIENDGVTHDGAALDAGHGNGIGNLAARVAAQRGRLSAAPCEPDRYRLAVTVPIGRGAHEQRQAR